MASPKLVYDTLRVGWIPLANVEAWRNQIIDALRAAGVEAKE